MAFFYFSASYFLVPSCILFINKIFLSQNNWVFLNYIKKNTPPWHLENNRITVPLYSRGWQACSVKIQKINVLRLCGPDWSVVYSPTLPQCLNPLKMWKTFSAQGSYKTIKYEQSISHCRSSNYQKTFLCTWNFPGKNTGVGCHFLLQALLCTDTHTHTHTQS